MCTSTVYCSRRSRANAPIKLLRNRGCGSACRRPGMCAAGARPERARRRRTAQGALQPIEATTQGNDMFLINQIMSLLKNMSMLRSAALVLCALAVAHAHLCPNSCSGNGVCVYPLCHCAAGMLGPACNVAGGVTVRAATPSTIATIIHPSHTRVNHPPLTILSV